MEKLYIIGHKNPDTDSILGVILLENYYKKLGYDAQAYRLGNINNETKYILDKFDISCPEYIDVIPNGSKVVLVDHNEESQTIDNISELTIFAIVDHHKFGGLSTSEPLFIRAEPLCSSCSVIYKMYKESNIQIDKDIAGLIISGIISDSLYFRSPTSTDFDKQLSIELNNIALINDLEKYSLEMFNAKSDLGNISIEELIKIDYKNFDFNGNKFGIGVLETTSPDYALNKKQEILEGMKLIKQDDKLDGILFSIVDILNEKNITFVISEFEAKLIKDVFDKDTIDGLVDLGPVVSRKKQIAPQIDTYFA